MGLDTNSDTNVALATLPKVELHVHLEGTITAEVATTLARGHGEDPHAVLGLVDGGYPLKYRDFDHFVAVFLAASRQLRTPDDLTRVAAAFARQQAQQNVLYSEATVTVGTLVDQGMDAAAIWSALNDGFAEVPDTRIGLIVDSIRELGPDNARATVDLVGAADAPVVALGLTGIEGSLPESEFALLRTAADDLGIGLVVHAGETGKADNVRAALDELGADRIGHGIAAVNDSALLDRLARDGTVLEVCPSSNVTLGIVDGLDVHPLPKLVEAGVAVTINSDDPPFFSTTLTDELAHARQLLGLDRAGLADVQRRAIDASFAPAEIVADVHSRLDAWVVGTDA